MKSMLDRVSAKEWIKLYFECEQCDRVMILFGDYSAAPDYVAGMIDGLLAEHAGHNFKMFEDPNNIEREFICDKRPPP